MPPQRTPAWQRALLRLVGEYDTLDPAECWLWPGALYSNGYGHIGGYRDDKRCDLLVHVVMFEAFVGAVPPGMDLHHTCHGPPCVGGAACLHRRCANFYHLQLATRSENLRHGVNVGGDRRPGKYRPKARAAR